MTELAVALLGATTLAGVVLLRRWQDAQVDGRKSVTYRLDFGRSLDDQVVTAFLNSLAGLRSGGPGRLTDTPALVFETTATAEGGMVHHLTMPERLADAVVAQLQVVPVRLTPAPDYRPGGVSQGRELRLTSLSRLLRSDHPASASASLLASLQPLNPDELVMVQWVVLPGGPRPPVRRSSGLMARLWPVGGRTGRDPDERSRVEEPEFAAVLRLGVRATTPGRGRQLLSRIGASFAVVARPGVRLVPRLLPEHLIAARLEGQVKPLVAWPIFLSVPELAAVLGWPIGGPQLAGLTFGGCRHLAPSPLVPSTGTVLARANFPGLVDRPIAVRPDDRLMHLWVCGPTGSGKSAVLLNLASQDMRAGQGLVLIDPKGDLVADCLDRVPPERIKDVIVVDPADDERPVGLNVLGGGGQSPDVVVENVTGVFRNLYAASWGPRTDDVLRAALATLTLWPQATLCELPRLLTDEGWRRLVVRRVSDPVVGQFWGWFESLSVAERAAVIAPILNKVRAFVMRPRLRNIVGQSQSGLDFDRVLARGKIVLVNLARGSVGQLAAALFGSLVVSQLWLATLRRAALPTSQRPRFSLYLDEAQDLLHVPVDLGDLMAQARSLGVAATLANQHVAQLPPPLRAAVLANCRTKLVFQLGADDARVLAREFAPHLGAEDLQGLGPFQAAMAVAVGSVTAPPATGVTLPPPPTTGQAGAARAWSRQHYGRNRAEVEAAIRARLEGPRTDGRVGQKRRAS